MQLEAVVVAAIAVALVAAAAIYRRIKDGPIPPSPAKDFAKYASADAYVNAKVAEYRAKMDA